MTGDWYDRDIAVNASASTVSWAQLAGSVFLFFVFLFFFFLIKILHIIYSHSRL